MKPLELIRAEVTRIAGSERLTRPYRFTIDIACPDPDLDLDALIAQPAALSLRDDERKRLFHGVILEASEAGRAAGEQFAYRLTLAPRLELLTLSRCGRTFGTDNAMSVIDVITAVLTASDAAGLAQDDFTFRLLDPKLYPKRDFWVQYEESDFDFVHRLLEHWGLFYFFEQTDTHERVVFTDSVVTVSPSDDAMTVIYDDRGQNRSTDDALVTTLSRRLRAIPARVVLKDYNPMTSNASPSASSDVKRGTRGVQQEYGANFVDNDEGALFAKARAEEIAADRDLFAMTSTSPFIPAGSAFRLTRHFRRALNQGYFVTEVRHSGVQPLAGGFGAGSEESSPGYTAELTAIPSVSPYRSPRRIRRPLMAGVLPAVVEAREGKDARADLDEYGRYRVKIDFDTAQAPEFQRSSALRMAQPYAGPHTGMHFPLLKGTEVALGWMGGDPDRPLIMGAVPNAQTKSPTVKANNTENRIKTPSGMVFVMDDRPAAAPKDGGGDGGLSAKPQASSGQDRGKGGQPTVEDPPNTTIAVNAPYTALVVPASDDTKRPNYNRLGMSPETESDMLNSTLFKSALSDDKGIYTSPDVNGDFSYTLFNTTFATGQNYLSIVGGDQMINVAGNAKLVVRGDKGYTQVIAANKTAAKDDQWVAKSLKFDTVAYSGSVSYTPTIGYTDNYSIAAKASLAYSMSVSDDISVKLSPLGGFACSIGPTYTLKGAEKILDVIKVNVLRDLLPDSVTIGVDGKITGKSTLGGGGTTFVDKPYKVSFRDLSEVGSQANLASIAISAAAKKSAYAMTTMALAMGGMQGLMYLDNDKNTTANVDSKVKGWETLGTSGALTLGSLAAQFYIAAQGKIYEKSFHKALDAEYTYPTILLTKSGTRILAGSGSNAAAVLAAGAGTASPTDSSELSKDGTAGVVVKKGGIRIDASGIGLKSSDTVTGIIIVSEKFKITLSQSSLSITAPNTPGAITLGDDGAITIKGKTIVLDGPVTMKQKVTGLSAANFKGVVSAVKLQGG
jgi:type VI secretion system VgrG family protein